MLGGSYLSANKSEKCITCKQEQSRKAWLSALQCKVGPLCFILSTVTVY